VGAAQTAGAAEREARAPQRWRPGGRRGAAVLAALLVAVTAVLLLRPAGPELADRTEHVRRNRVLPALSSDPLRQRFAAAEDDLSQVTIRFATGDGQAQDCAVEARVVGPRGVLGSRSARCRDLGQADEWAIHVRPARAGEELALEVVRTAGDDPIALWGGPSDGSLPPAEAGGVPLDVSVELHTAYGGDGVAAGQLSTVLRRIDGYGPFWHHPVAVVLLAAIAAAALVAVGAARLRLGLVLVVVFAVAKGVLWSVVVPPFGGPDEPAHYSYAQFLAEDHRIPRRGTDYRGDPEFFSEEARLAEDGIFHQTAAQPGNRPDFTSGGRAANEEALDRAGKRSGGDSSAAGYAPHYYAPAALVYEVTPGGFTAKLAAMRLWSVALGAVAALLAVQIGRRLFPTSEAAPLALGVAVAAQPMLSQQTAIVNNDGLVIVAGFACLLLALQLLEPRAPRRLLLLAGLLGGLALVAKPFGAALAPVLGLAWLLGRARTEPADRSSWIREVGAAALGFAISAGTWFGFAALFGYPNTSVGTADPTKVRTIGRYLLLNRLSWFSPVRQHWIDQLWGRFLYLTVGYPGWIVTVLTLVTLASVVVVAVASVRAVLRLWRARGELRARVQGALDLQADLSLIVCSVTVVLALAVLQVLDFLRFRQLGYLELLQGRYLLLVLPAVVALPALAVRHLTGNERAARLVLLTVAAGTVVLHLVGLALVVDASYV
jgi:hypothetical protein